MHKPDHWLFSLSENSLPLIEPQGTLPRSQKPTLGPIPSHLNLVDTFTIHFKYILIVFFLLCPAFPRGLFPSN